MREVGDRRGAIAAMAKAFEDRGRTPRLEFFAELWPGLAAALEAEGFVLERRGEVMACARLDLASPFLAPAAPHLLARDEPLPRLAAFPAGAAEAFGEQAAVSASGELERFADGCARARSRRPWCRRTGGDAGKRRHADLRRRVAELPGCGPGRVAPPRPRAGGARCCSRGSSPRRRRRPLSAGGTASAGLYRSLGFWPCGTQLNYARPGARA